MTKTGRFYNSIAIFYPIVDFFFRKQKRVLVSIINELPFGNLLEVGIGNGSMLPMYTRHIISGIDLSMQMLSIARKRKTKVPVHLFLADAEDMRFASESFDYVVMSHMLAVTKHPEVLLNNIHRVLKPGGKLIILNHFTPSNMLSLLDILLVPVAALFQFKSFFRLSSFKGLEKFRLQHQVISKPFGYYKIIFFEK